jgi:hypothetical protein
LLDLTLLDLTLLDLTLLDLTLLDLTLLDLTLLDLTFLDLIMQSIQPHRLSPFSGRRSAVVHLSPMHHGMMMGTGTGVYPGAYG